MFAELYTVVSYPLPNDRDPEGGFRHTKSVSHLALLFVDIYICHEITMGS